MDKNNTIYGFGEKKVGRKFSPEKIFCNQNF